MVVLTGICNFQVPRTISNQFIFLQIKRDTLLEIVVLYWRQMITEQPGIFSPTLCKCLGNQFSLRILILAMPLACLMFTFQVILQKSLKQPTGELIGMLNLLDVSTIKRCPFCRFRYWVCRWGYSVEDYNLSLILKTTNGGDSWNIQVYESGYYAPPYHSVFFVNPNIGYVLGTFWWGALSVKQPMGVITGQGELHIPINPG